MISVGISDIRPNDPIPSFTFKSLVYIFIRKFPNRFTSHNAEEQIIFIIARDRGSMFGFS